MVASIKSTLLDSPGGVPVPGAPVLIGVSRDDLRKGYQVELESVDVHATYLWELVFAPDAPDGTASAAAMIDPTLQIARFNVDHEGPYLVKLTVDDTLPTEDIQYVRMRFVTRFANVELVSGNERNDSMGAIPVDIDVDGWSQTQNQNVQKLLGFVRRGSSSGRVLYVDANRGRDRTNTPNDASNSVDFPGSDPTDVDGSGFAVTTEGFADFASVSDAITYASNAVARGEPAPSTDDPYTIFVQPGFYEEDVTFQPHIHIRGLGVQPTLFDSPFFSFYVIIRGHHTYAGTTPLDFLTLENLVLENTIVSADPVLEHLGGSLFLYGCGLFQGADSATQGPCLLVSSAIPAGTILICKDTRFLSLATTSDDNYVIITDALNNLSQFSDCWASGRSVMSINPSHYTGADIGLVRCSFNSDQGYNIRGCSDRLSVLDCDISARTSTQNIVIDANGDPPGSLASDVYVEIHRSDINGDITFDTAVMTGTSDLRVGSLVIPDSATTFIFPTAVPGNFLADVDGGTLRYSSNYTDPATGSVLVPSGWQLSADTLQKAVDELVVREAFLTTVTLDSAGSYSLPAVIEYVGVDTATAGGSIDVALPETEVAGAEDGRKVVIKDEGGGSAVVGQEINVYVGGAIGTIDGTIRDVAGPLVISTNYQSLTLICRGESGGTSHWFTA